MISEIMYAVDDRGRLSQWIELRNVSKTNGVDVGSWSLYIVNHSEMLDGAGGMVEYSGEFVEEIKLSGTIPPGQTYLIVAHRSSDDTNLPRERIKLSSADRSRGDLLLNPYGFQLTLRTKNGELKR